MLGRAIAAAAVLGACLAGALGEDAAGARRREGLLALHRADAGSYAIFRDPGRTRRLALRDEPIYRWSNPTRAGGQEGDVFVWVDRGHPEAVGSIFSHPEGGDGRLLCHELHSLSDSVLVVDRDSPNRWEPSAPGIEWKPIPDAPAPAPTPAARAAQLRALAREFSGRSFSEEGRAWELRLLPKPLLLYGADGPDAREGALYALVSDAGTDPEIILLIEPRPGPAGPRWSYAAARFSDMSLWLRHKGRDVWSRIRGPENTFNADAGQRFRFYQDRVVPEVGAPGPAAKAEGK